jgi:hypothetical protein
MSMPGEADSGFRSALRTLVDRQISRHLPDPDVGDPMEWPSGARDPFIMKIEKYDDPRGMSGLWNPPPRA